VTRFAALLTAAAAAAQEPDDAFAARARSAIEATVEERHFDAAHLDSDSRVAQAVVQVLYREPSTRTVGRTLISLVVEK
jgi:hypothetical protein